MIFVANKVSRSGESGQNNEQKNRKNVDKKDLFSLTETEKKLLDSVRTLEGETLTDIANHAGLIVQTASSLSTGLENAGMIYKDDNTRRHIQTDYGYFMGVSIGSAHVSVAICNFAFDYIRTDKVAQHLEKNSVYLPHCPRGGAKTNYWAAKGFRLAADTEDCPSCMRTNAGEEPYAVWRADTEIGKPFDMSTAVNDLAKFAIELKKKGLNLLSISYAFPGHVDVKENKIIRSNKPEFSIINTPADELPFVDTVDQLNELGIKLFVDNHSAACAVAELHHSKGCLQNKTEADSNSAVIYLGGSGFGISFVLDNNIYRGKTSQAGTNFGHTPIKFGKFTRDDKCDCGQYGCFEQKIRSLFKKTSDKTDFMKKHSGSEIAAFLNKEENAAVKQKFCEYMFRATWSTISLFEIDHLIWSGKGAVVFSDSLQGQFKNQFLMVERGPKISVSNLGIFAPVTGVAINGFYRLING